MHQIAQTTKNKRETEQKHTMYPLLEQDQLKIYADDEGRYTISGSVAVTCTTVAPADKPSSMLTLYSSVENVGLARFLITLTYTVA